MLLVFSGYFSQWSERASVLKWPLSLFVFFCVVTSMTLHFGQRAHFQYGRRQGVSCNFLVSLLSKALFGKITVICGKSE